MSPSITACSPSGRSNASIFPTPKEGLSLQRLKEFADSGIDAELFDKGGRSMRSMFSGQTMEIIYVNKLADRLNPGGHGVPG